MLTSAAGNFLEERDDKMRLDCMAIKKLDWSNISESKIKVEYLNLPKFSKKLENFTTKLDFPNVPKAQVTGAILNLAAVTTTILGIVCRQFSRREHGV